MREVAGKEVLNAIEAARILGCSDSAVSKMAVYGELPGRKVGKCWQFSKSEVEKKAPAMRERLALHAGRQEKRVGLCPAGPVPGLAGALDEIGVAPGEFAFVSGLPFALINKLVEDGSAWVKAKERERILETVVHMRREQRDEKMAEEKRKIREAMG